MLLAVVDLGSNSFKMTVAQWVPNLRAARPFRVLHKERHPVQLGRSVFASGRISPKSRKAAYRALEAMHMRLRDFSAPVLRVVATSAIREASDGREFVSDVREALGIPIEVITGAEEARLIAQGLEWEYPRTQRGLLVDIGGGSTEVASFGPGWKPDFLHSFRLGSVRVATQHFEGRKKPKLAEIRRAVRHSLSRVRAPRDVETLIGSAGTIQSLGEILGVKRGSSTVVRLANLDAWIETNIGTKAATLARAWDLTPSRARIVVPGSIVLSEILRWLGRDSIAVTSMTLRDGLLVDLVTKWRDEERALRRVSIERSTSSREKEFSESLLAFLDQAALRFGLDRVRSAHTAMLATRLFDGLVSAGFPMSPSERLYLFVVAYLHRCGQLVSVPGFHRHSAYILRHLNIPGFAENERDLLSLMAFFQRKGEAPRRDPLPLGVKGRAANEVRRVSALLRLVLALDPEGTGQVSDIRVRKARKQLLLELYLARSTSLDLKSLREAARAFETQFGLKVVPFAHPAPMTLARS